MTDRNIDPELELSVAMLAKACKGDVSKLPSFVVHDNEAWPWKGARPDNQNRIHMRRSTFLRCVTPNLPVRPGLWIRPDAQQYFLDLKPHHLQGSEDTRSDARKTAREVVKMDEAGLLPEEDGYGDFAKANSERRKIDLHDLRDVATRNEKGSVRSSTLVHPRSE